MSKISLRLVLLVDAYENECNDLSSRTWFLEFLRILLSTLIELPIVEFGVVLSFGSLLLLVIEGAF